MDESANEFPGVGVDQFPLPFRQDDSPCVLRAGPVLGKQAGEVVGIDLDVVAADSRDPVHTVVGKHGAHDRLALVLDAGPGVVHGDRQTGGAVSGTAEDVPVAQVEAEELDVCGGVQLASVAARAEWGPAARALAALGEVFVLPVADGAIRYAEAACDLAVGYAIPQQSQCFLADFERVEDHDSDFRERISGMRTKNGTPPEGEIPFRVPGAGLEPACPFRQMCLRHPRMPVPPTRRAH